MHRLVAVPAVLLLLAACTPGPNAAMTPGDSARAEVEAQMPDVDVDAIAGCVRENATAEELQSLAQGTGAAQHSLTAQIIQRPETMQCIQAANAVPTGA